jgi:hypothetical protein
LIKDTLEDSEKGQETKVFVFDAWAHGGDPLRRSFLESLITFLAAETWLPRQDWSDELEHLSHRREEVETQTEPLLTPLGVALALTLFLTPIGFALFANFTSADLIGYEVLGQFRLFLLGLFLALGPLAVIAVALVRTRNQQREGLGGLIPILLNRTSEKTTSRTRRTPEPTSLEFSSVFSRVLDGALASPERRLVIVIDNLDRVGEEDARSVWSTMRVFFDPGRPVVPDWNNQLWLLIPFDSTSLKKIWAGTDEDDDLARSFEDKTFQVTFHVSPPVLSDWRAFLLVQLELALPDHDKDDFETIYRVFRRRGLPANRNLTPRDIKIFVNKLGALHRQWQDEIPASLQAYYALERDSITPERLTSSDFGDPRILTDLDAADWRKQLAALHFNVPVEKSLQILLEKQIEEFLGTQDYDALLELASVPGFQQVLEEFVDRSQSAWAQGDPALISATAHFLSRLAGNQGQAGLGLLWKLLRLAAERVDRWTVFDPAVAEGLVLIVEAAPPAARPNLIQSLLKSAGRSVFSSETAE